MWTHADRVMVGNFGSGQALTDDQFRLLEPLLPPAKPGGRPRSTDMRNLLDGLFYLVRTGCQWPHLPPPPAFPPWRTVYGYLRGFLSDGVWENIRHHLVVTLREGASRDASPSAAVVDTHSVKTTESGGPRGWDAAKRLKGRERHGAVDADGLLLGILVHSADIQDANGLSVLLQRLKPLYNWLRVVFADSIYNRLADLLACFVFGLALIIVRRPAGIFGFVVQPRRWVVGRSLGWFGRWRQLSKDDEALPEVSEAMVTPRRWPKFPRQWSPWLRSA
ncbi:MAG: IS5 family transposase [Proteobacteria bacterium]|nr:MAG: IS5 family transposase [Pseudomonadota bacterium]